ncbi:PP2C family protein-serine/threonine phosphatase [Pseudonocardia acidicola]|uniref:Serine/threonine-protein phosphatase n=1 Tax=Pseudonocardia acidicola TaxID=2724939 RepID=A0ABX1SIC9_9PSEU|nr:protein phosphatase 2C domain-containing protein [Pseudonocardia acidicola]NMH99928.1 serine/threonine-protein phosphatase [Pseudonocardia acidicola]
MALGLRSAIGSDVGRMRAANQDSGAASARLLAVADGMGGHAHGEVASALTIAAFADLDDRLPADLHDVDLSAALAGALADAARRLGERAGRDPGLRGMGTTAIAVLLDDNRLGMLHIGDSRIYLLRGGVLEQVTRDHTVVQALVDEGRITAEEATTHPRRSVLLRALQAGHEPEPDLCERAAIVGDRYLLCSDGVTAVLNDAAVHEALAADADPAAVVQRLIALANQGGGPDNITCVVADVVEAPEPEQGRVLVGAAADIAVAG